MTRESRELQEAIKAEVALWPGASVSFEPGKGGGHPKAKLEFAPEEGPPMIFRRAYNGNSNGNPVAVIATLKDMRRSLTQLGAVRSEEPSAAKDEETAAKVYHKPNEGAAKPEPVVAGEKATLKATVAEQLEKTGLVSAAELEAGTTKAMSVPWESSEDDDAGPAPPGRAEIEAGWEAAALAVVDGIYFGMSEDVYHRVRRVSTSGLSKIAVSAGTFWEESWLNPTPRKLTEDQHKSRDRTRMIGRAYHCARLEPDQFEGRYARQITKADFEGVEGFLRNGDEIGAALSDYGETKKRAGESVLDQARRLEDCGYEGPIFPLEEARWRAGLDGRVAIDAVEWDNMLIDMERLHKNADIAALLSGGQAEVSIFWTDRYGIPCKCRVDYLTAAWWTEFKTFANSQSKPLKQAINDALRYNRYFIGATVYREGVEEVRGGNLQIIGDASDEERELIAAIQLRPAELECWFVFQEKGGVPNILGKRFNFFSVPHNMKLWEPGATEAQIAAGEAATRTKTGLFIRGLQAVEAAKREFVLYSQSYVEGEPWAPIEALGEFDDMDFNRNWLEGHYD